MKRLLLLSLAVSGCARWGFDLAADDRGSVVQDASRLDRLDGRHDLGASDASDRLDRSPLPELRRDLPEPGVDLPSPDLDLSKPDLLKPDLAKPDQGSCIIHGFSFAAVAHQPPAKTVVYGGDGGVTVQGSAGCTVNATVSGPGNPAFDVSGLGLWQTAGKIQVGQKVRFRVTTSSTAGATITATLAIGYQAASWSVTTCSGSTCMKGAIGANTGCDYPETRVTSWTCPGSSEVIHAKELTFQFAGTGLLACPAGATCTWEDCGGNGWEVGTLACP